MPQQLHNDACRHTLRLNLPEEKHSHGLRRLAAVEAARGSFDEAAGAVEPATGDRLGKRQVEELAARSGARSPPCTGRSFGSARDSVSRKRPNPGQVSGRGAGEQLRSPLFQGCHLGPQAVQFAIYLRKRRLRLSFLQVVVPTCCLDECLNLRSEKAQPGIAVDGTLSVLQLAVADRLDDLVLSESELGASSLVAQGGALAPPLGFEAVDDSPLPRNGLGNGAAGDDMVSDAHAVRVLNRGYRRARGRAWAVCEQQGGSGDVPDSELARRYRRIPFQITPSPVATTRPASASPSRSRQQR